jgi:hypothetical protein
MDMHVLEGNAGDEGAWGGYQGEREWNGREVGC